MIAPKQITITLDGKRCTGTEGQTILEIARAHDVYIPTLCYLKGLSAWGGCRLCIVEVAGNPKVVPSCATPAVDGQVITTQSERLQELRKFTLELLFSERNHICPMCPYNKGDCGLQHQGMAHGITHIRLPYLYPSLPVDLSGRYFGLDHNRCILCTRCVRTCDELEGVHTLDIANRGALNRVVVDLGATFGTSETCTRCGACVANCPTGALFDKAAAFRGPLASCQTVSTTCLECPVGCGLKVFTREDRIVNVWGDPDAEPCRGHLCVKGRYETWADGKRRILTPLVRRDGKLMPATWEQALAEITAASRGLKNDEKALLVSPRLTNETIPLVQKQMQQARVGMFVARHEAALCGAAERSPDAVRRIVDADAIIILGAQPTRDNGGVAAKIRTTVRKKGAKLLIFHARKSDLDVYADVCAHVVGLEHKFWDQVAAVLADVTRPVLVYGPAAMTPIGVTVMEKLIAIFEKRSGCQPPALVGLPVTTNSLTLAAAGIEPLEEIGPWLDERNVKFLHILASDEPDGGARVLEEKYVPGLLERVDCVVVSAAYPSRLTEYAKVVLPAATWNEKSGTVTNFEGRAQPVRAITSPRGEARDDRAILEALSA